MTDSKLATRTLISPNHSNGRNLPLTRVTIHCFVGQVTAEQGLAAFKDPNKKASCNYVIGKDGSIGLCVHERDRSWCSSSADNDNRAITIEVASDSKPPYAVTDKAMNALLDLLTDIGKRNGKRKYIWFGDKNKSTSYIPDDDEMVMTVHRWFANKECPGEYLMQRHGEIAKAVNNRLSGGNQEFAEFIVRVKIPDLYIRTGPGNHFQTKGFTGKGVFTIIEVYGDWGRLKSGEGWIYLGNSRYTERV